MDLLEQIKMLRDMSRNRMVGVHPILQAWTLKIVEAAAYHNLYFAAFMGLRTWELQDALYSQGREQLDVVNARRSLAGLGPITAEENKKIVTNARGGDSWHNYGLAVDLVEDGDAQQAGVQWSWSKNLDYLSLGKVVQTTRLEWGGLWKSIKDYPHIQMTCGLSLAIAKDRYLRSRDIKKVWTEVEKTMPPDLRNIAA